MEDCLVWELSLINSFGVISKLMTKITEEQFKHACKTCNGTSDVLRYFGAHCNGSTRRQFALMAENFGIPLPKYRAQKKYELIEKKCPVCFKPFTTLLGNKREKTVCSHSCSNTHFRSGEQNGNYNPESYRNICFKHHEKKCCICDFDNIVEVHHMDCNKENNDPINLIPLCPNHHQMFHSRHRPLVKPLIEEYISGYSREA